MKEIRKQIDGIDKKIISLLGKRFKLAPKMAKFKKKESLPIQDKKREAEILEKYEKMAKKEDINAKFVKKLWTEIFKESRRIQRLKK